MDTYTFRQCVRVFLIYCAGFLLPDLNIFCRSAHYGEFTVILRPIRNDWG